MNLRDVKVSTLKRLAAECEEEFEKWSESTNSTVWFTSNDGLTQSIPATPHDIWRYAFSRGTSAILRHVTELKEDA